MHAYNVYIYTCINVYIYIHIYIHVYVYISHMKPSVSTSCLSKVSTLVHLKRQHPICAFQKSAPLYISNVSTLTNPMGISQYITVCSGVLVVVSARTNKSHHHHYCAFQKSAP